MRHDNVAILVPLLGHDPVLDDWNRRALSRTVADSDHADARVARAPRFSEHFVGVVEALSIGHQNDRAVAGSFVQCQEVGRLSECTGQRASTLANDRRIEILQKKVECTVVDGEWSEDVAASRERQQAEAVTRRKIPKPVDLLLHRLKPARTFVGGQHRQ